MWLKPAFLVLLIAATLSACSHTQEAAEPPAIADVHLHYNWNQSENTPPEEAAAILKHHNVQLAVVSSIPPKLALELKQEAPDVIIPMFTPYLTPIHRKMWYTRPEVVEKAREALASGEYQALGEVHLIPGLGPRRDNPVFQDLLALAQEFDVPFLLHTDASSYRYVLPLCEQHKNARILWAHAGGILPPEQVTALLNACPNVSVELSSRDPWRYINNPITDEDGHLLPAWRQAIDAHPERYMIGADALWPVTQMHGWFSDDTGWKKMDDFYHFHLTWIADFPDDIQLKLRQTNALRFFHQDASL